MFLTWPFHDYFNLYQYPKRVSTNISIDFVEGLLVSKEKDAVISIVDRFIKYAHFIAISYPFTTLDIII
jgi:hypothetical protein